MPFASVLKYLPACGCPTTKSLLQLSPTSRNGPHSKHCSSVGFASVEITKWSLLNHCLVTAAVYKSSKRFLYSCLLLGRCLATRLHVTVLWKFVHTSQKTRTHMHAHTHTRNVSVTETDRLSTEIIPAHSELYETHKHAVWAKMVMILIIKNLCGTHSNHCT
jgi:hypothetical protein